ncbi:nuclear transport factor 2 family protein [Olivibacter sp. XZL3]|uniref:nuclear transport factor 2 family protein n=1 Tax=Olivibacter sp. XZL3 TaxID=1735116 RepID=UPI00106715B0|nr:nuclear transport factor 2 family protein [Olivibacter sp. XZL3]
MNIPKVIANLVEAQNNHDSIAYANCFSETAVVFDEGKKHNGRKEIERWIADANQQFNTIMKPVSFKEQETTSILEAEVSGTFDGSPVILSYHFEIVDEQIQSLKITG